jgi:guanosine-3',5'-bis(diphosphate) 3'-pyrophosphohydrolase
MMLAMVDDIRVVLIKLADRLHNMRTLEHLQPDRQRKIAEETLEIYAPIAHRLGMGKIRGELEDLGFRFLDPAGYEQVEKIRQRPPQRGRSLSRQDAADHQRQAERGRHPGQGR